MPLLDHFHPPLSQRRHWHAFHNHWAAALAADLNERLPAWFYAEPNVQFGIEIDVATFEEPGATASSGATAGWQPTTPSRTIPFTQVSDAVEVLVYRTEGGPELAGAIELVSPANKDRQAHREAFVAKCQTYLQQGVGLVLVDAVTSRQGNLHVELVRRLGADTEIAASLYAVAYRVTRPAEDAYGLELWEEPLSLGQPLPTLPLWLRDGPVIPLHLDPPYLRTCRELRITEAAATGGA